MSKKPRIHNFNPVAENNQSVIGSYKLGLVYYKGNVLALSKKHFVNVIKPLLTKQALEKPLLSMASLKDQLLGSMYHLGKIYLVSGNYSEATGIFQYCAKFSEQYKIGNSEYFIQRAYQVEGCFLKDIRAGIAASDYSKPQIENLKQDLLVFRSSISKKLDSLESSCIKTIAQRASLVEQIYKDCTSFYVNHHSKEGGLVQKLIRQCVDQLGKPPAGVDYAIIGLGSISGGKITPYSDLEFAILIREDIEAHKQYFRDLTKLLHIKIINFGETPVRMIGIEALNNFRTLKGQDDWFWDNMTPSGFSFDGPHWHACKTPLGRYGYNRKDDFELIRTPQKMLEFQLEGLRIKNAKNWFESDVYLVHSIRHVLLIEGNQTLLDIYRQGLKSIDQALVRARVLKILEGDIVEFGLKIGSAQEGRLYNVKQEIYRITDKVIDLLADYYKIMPEDREAGLTAWQIIQIMEEQVVLSPCGARHLKEALSIAAELRLRTYCHTKGQVENLSTSQIVVEHLSIKQQKELLDKTLYLKGTRLLRHFYYVMLRLQKLISDFCVRNKQSALESLRLEKDDLLDHSDYTKAMVHARFLKYTAALRFMEKAKENFSNNESFLDNLYYLYTKTNNADKMLEVAMDIYVLKNIRYGSKDLDTPYIANGLRKLGLAKLAKGNYVEARSSFDEALHILLAPHNNKDNKAVSSEVIYNLISLAETHYAIIRNVRAGQIGQKKRVEYIEYHKKQMMKYCALITDKLLLANYYDVLGKICVIGSNSKEALDYFNEALKIKISVYTKTPNHPDIANSYNFLAHVMCINGFYKQAEDYVRKALAIQKIAYKSFENHPDMSITCRNFGKIAYCTEDYRKAITYFKVAIHILEETNMETVYHHTLQMTDNYKLLMIAYKRLVSCEKMASCEKTAIEDKLEHLNAWINIDAQLVKYQSQLLTAVRSRNIEDIDKIIHCYEQAIGLYKISGGYADAIPIIEEPIADYGGMNLIQIACDNGHREVVTHLVEEHAVEIHGRDVILPEYSL